MPYLQSERLMNLKRCILWDIKKCISVMLKRCHEYHDTVLAYYLIAQCVMQSDAQSELSAQER